MSVGMHIGSLILHPVSDGTFVARPEYFGASGSPGPHPEFFSRGGAAWLPIGCFPVRADPVLAARTREQLWQEPEDEHTIGVGAH